ncbi:MAG: Bax inhibitor-1 family protein [Myxococcota bacterium]
MTQGQYAAPSYGAVAHADVETRASFIAKTYGHLAGMIALFVAFIGIYLVTPIARTLVELVYARGGQVGHLIFLGLFVVVSTMADNWARRSTDVRTQYIAAATYVALQGLFIAPMIYIATAIGGAALPMQAFVITGVLFAALTLVVFVTRKDFSFLRSAIMFLTIAIIVAAVGAAIFNFQLPTLILWAGVVLAAMSILYNTSGVMLHYREGQHVAASLSLFASFALLLWYVLQLLMSSRD